MAKRAVSPLIATILLVALTISIGAMIIGWGKEYVKKQTKCIGYEIDILNAKADYTNRILKVSVHNKGTEDLILSTEASPLVFHAVIAGQDYYCAVADPATIGATGCAIKKGTADLAAGQIGTIEIHFGSGIDLSKYEEGEFIIKGCGTIGEKIMPYMLT